MYSTPPFSEGLGVFPPQESFGNLAVSRLILVGFESYLTTTMLVYYLCSIHSTRYTHVYVPRAAAVGVWSSHFMHGLLYSERCTLLR